MSEFGKGFIYNLILFAKHYERFISGMQIYEKMYKDEKSRKEARDMSIHSSFNGASDHFYELEIPEKWKDTEIGILAGSLRNKALEYGHGYTVKLIEEDFKKVYNELEELAILIDKELGVDAEAAEYN